MPYESKSICLISAEKFRKSTKGKESGLDSIKFYQYQSDIKNYKAFDEK